MAKLLKLRRGTTSQHSSFTGAEGELTIDTTKDTAVVHDGSTAGGRALLREDLDNMPASGVSAGTYGSSSAIPAITVNAEGLVTGATTSAIDSTAIANGTSNVSVANNGEVTVVRAGSTKLVTKSDGVDVTGELQCDTLDVDGAGDISGNLSLGGNLAVGGTVDGRDVASDGSKLDGIESGATGDQTASEILNAIKTVDGSGSGLDADLLDGESSAYYRNASNLNAGTISSSLLPVINSVPSGAILIWSGSVANIPTGYVLCNGSNSTPDLRNRFVVGAGTGSNYTISDTGGSNTTTLTTGHLPSHSHSTPNHTHTINGHTHSTPNHSHVVDNHTHSTPNHSHGVNAHSHSTPNHNHNMNSHTHSTSNTGSHSHSLYFRRETNDGSNYYQNNHIMRGRVENSGGNHNTNSAGNHSHNTNSGTSNTNASGGGNTGNAGANTSNSGGSNTGGSAPNTTSGGGSNTGSTGLTTTSGGGSNTGSAGSGAAFENRPPFFALCYIMKT